MQIFTVLAVFTQIAKAAQSLWTDYPTDKCSNSGNFKYISGNALTDAPNCVGPNNAPYPSSLISRTFSNWNSGGSSRRGRMSQLPTMDPMITQKALLRAYGDANEEQFEDVRTRYSKFKLILENSFSSLNLRKHLQTFSDA